MRLFAVQAFERGSHPRAARDPTTEQSPEPQRETQPRESVDLLWLGRRPDRDGRSGAGRQNRRVGREVAQQDSEETRANTRPLAIVGMDEAVDRIARKGARERASA